MDIPPITISEKTSWSLASSNGNSAARRASFIIFITCIHKGCCEEGRSWRKSWAAPTMMSHSATFVSRMVCSSGSFWGSFGGMKTGSMTKRKTSDLGKSARGVGMIVENKSTDTALMWHWDPGFYEPYDTSPQVPPPSPNGESLVPVAVC